VKHDKDGAWSLVWLGALIVGALLGLLIGFLLAGGPE
jgi:hypothetical protein